MSLPVFVSLSRGLIVFIASDSKADHHAWAISYHMEGLPPHPAPLKGNTFCSSLLSFQPSQSSFNPILSFSSEPVFIYPIFFLPLFFSFILEENIEFSSQTIYIKYPTGNLKQREQFPFLSVSITFPEGIKPRKYLV